MWHVFPVFELFAWQERSSCNCGRSHVPMPMWLSIERGRGMSAINPYIRFAPAMLPKYCFIVTWSGRNYWRTCSFADDIIRRKRFGRHQPSNRTWSSGRNHRRQRQRWQQLPRGSPRRSPAREWLLSRGRQLCPGSAAAMASSCIHQVAGHFTLCALLDESERRQEFI